MNDDFIQETVSCVFSGLVNGKHTYIHTACMMFLIINKAACSECWQLLLHFINDG